MPSTSATPDPVRSPKWDRQKFLAELHAKETLRAALTDHEAALLELLEVKGDPEAIRSLLTLFRSLHHVARVTQELAIITKQFGDERRDRTSEATARRLIDRKLHRYSNEQLDEMRDDFDRKGQVQADEDTTTQHPPVDTHRDSAGQDAKTEQIVDATSAPAVEVVEPKHPVRSTRQHNDPTLGDSPHEPEERRGDPEVEEVVQSFAWRAEPAGELASHQNAQDTAVGVSSGVQVSR